MAGRGPDRRSTSIDVLRSELENIEEADVLVPPRPSSRDVPQAEVEPGQAARDIDEGGFSEARRASSSSRRSRDAGHIRFPDDTRHRERHRGHEPPHLRLDTNLYPIQSSIDDTEAATRWREGRGQNVTSEVYASSSGRGRRLEDEEPRPSRVGFAEPTVITSRPRHRHLRLGRFQGNVKNVAHAAEASATISRAKDWVARQRARTNHLKRTPTGRFKNIRLARAYKKWILEKLLRQKPLPPSADGRHIPLKPGLARREDLEDERTGRPYVSNFIRSSRYTLWSFLPKQMFFQFSKLANAYFLTIGILQMIPGLSTTGTYTTIGPLIAFVAISMAKEGWDDYRRYKLDKLENSTEAWVLDPARSVSAEKRRIKFRERFRRHEDVGGEMQELDEVGDREDEDASWSQDEEARWSKIKWEEIRVGDIIRLRRDENVPADIILLHATGPNGIAYIETMALDGETNLKSKQACPLFARHCGSLSDLQACEAEVVSEDPNLDLYNYEGKAVVNGEASPLTLNQVVYRGSTLRNTNEAIGVVVNTGEECKIRMNASKNVHAKAPAMQTKVNKIVILLVCFVILLSVGCSIGNIIWVNDYGKEAWYLNGYVVSFGEILIGFVIAFNTLIPLSLYVSLEIVKIGQVMLLRDVDMYDPKTDTPMVANTTTILEDLGQVSYVFSDKTGTLTENLMRFRKLSVAGTAWLHDMDVRREAEANKRRQTVLEVSGAKPGKGKGVQIGRASTSTIGSEPMEDPLMEESGISVCPPGRPSSVWTSTARPSQAQPQLRTDSLIQYIRQKPNSPFSEKARQFILCMALCHTCLPEKKADGRIEFQAASPDELALVEAAQDLGFLVIDRPSQSIKLQFSNEAGALTTEQYEILDVIEFSSKRKRMSIVIRMPDGKICVFIKGADSVIMPRLKLNKLASKPPGRLATTVTTT